MKPCVLPVVSLLTSVALGCALMFMPHIVYKYIMAGLVNPLSFTTGVP